jgi:hypothetical protein
MTGSPKQYDAAGDGLLVKNPVNLVNPVSFLGQDSQDFVEGGFAITQSAAKGS